MNKQSVDTPKPQPKPFGSTWRDHVLVKCSRCKGLMGHHIVSDDAVCVGCEIKERCAALKFDKTQRKFITPKVTK